ncbi:MAG: uncharacterized ferritin-like protein (DUF455 family) [Verrucomicrobiales bacterium]|jgi:uncharacterized ferritin-like protein (DUF455 family)
MQLREFAESILFAETVDAKLARPASEVVDLEPGTAIALPDQPGRPDELRFGRADSPPALPGVHELEDDAQRGVLLHFFCNHELLATELMALVLLRFPEAPAEFRRGVYETLREEQKHTLWYLRRMEECGVKFGDYPVSSFFWRSVAPMETPLDYVSRLSLTFEQANLDYSRFYASVFERSGDRKTASILKHIYKDEIDHVRSGLDWFRKWKDPNQSDWEAFGQHLLFPLSPSRAKANGVAQFNTEGRLKAGLDADFVRQLRIFERSKGRTPRVFWFCPDAENDMADDRYQRRADVEILARDLDILPAFLAAREDVVLVQRQPSLEHCERLQEAGFVLPEFEELGLDGQIKEDSLTRTRKLGGLRPWAWCPSSDRLFEPLEAARGWSSSVRELFSKVSDQQLLGGAVVDSLDELRRLAAEREVVVKAPFGASGQRNQRWSGEPTVRWAERVIAKQGAVVVEPWFDRVFDFSVQYEMERGGLRKVGITRVENNPRGQFVAAESGPKLLQGLDEALARFLAGEIRRYDEEIREQIEAHVEKAGYFGPVGVDAFVFRDEAGELRLRPIVELNPRFTMGRLTLELRKRIAATGNGSCLRFELIDKRKLDCSATPLNDPATAERTLAVFRVAPNFQDLRG